MTLATTKRYCIGITMADYYSAWIEADNESDALAKGIERWDADLGDFHFDASERLSVDIIDWECV